MSLSILGVGGAVSTEDVDEGADEGEDEVVGADRGLGELYE